MLPYYIGFHYANDFEDGEKASYYYKIASMQDDAPSATAFLGPIALARASNPRDAILSFLYIARDGYDAEPFECRKLTNELISDIMSNRVIDQVWVDAIRKREMSLQDPK